MKRSKHGLSHQRLVTGDMGRLIPVGLVEALPGDTFQHSTSMLLRMSPLLAPVMHPVSVRIHHWFVPNRLVWDGWEDFITGGPDGTGTADPFPTNPGSITVAPGDLLDYLGVPTGVAIPAGALNFMPVRAYNYIFNEFYRDQDLIAEVGEDVTNVQRVAWQKDYFTTARPWSQKGPMVTLPIGASAPVTGTITGQAGVAPVFDLSGLSAAHLGAALGTDTMWVDGTGSGDGPAYWNNPALNFSGSADLSQAVPPNIIDVRRAFALQRYQEARAQYGSRYTEYLRYLGVRPSDARMQRPEYLGGGKQTVSFSEVLRTGNESAATTSPIGEMKGHGIAALRSNRYRYFCEEHGYVISLLSLRPRTMYVDSLNRTWSRRTKEEYYQRELELIGQQEVYNREVRLEGDASDAEVFGYQDRYAEYRHQYSQVSGEFRTILDYWHMGRKFASTPVLNQSFIECDPTKRIFAEQTQHSCWMMLNHSIQARRLVGNNTIGRVI